PVFGGRAIVSDQPASATGEDALGQLSSADNHVIVGSPLTEMLSGNSDSSAFLFKTNLDHITDPEINFASNAKNHLLQLDEDGIMPCGACPAPAYSAVTQLANFKSADGGSARHSSVVPPDSPILTALLGDSSGTHGPAGPGFAKIFNVLGPVMSFAENV